ncbi:MAG: restriction endonuclease [Candidatus Parcubacteria bacterium]|nr:restriction endonuclease [Candidatus Parcubacteria bacterium]
MTYYEEKLNELRELLRLISIGKKDLTNERSTITNQYAGYLLLKEEVRKMAQERQKGFPHLAEAYDELFKLRDKNDIDWLIHKKRPAERASDLVKQYSLDKRQALKERKIYEYLVKYYEDICPFLVDLREEEIGNLEMIDQEVLKEYSEEELQDEATKYLTKEEYRKLPSIERNQMALDRFWKRPKSKWIIGRLYERYIGYLYEEQGYDVEYVGIFKGYEDLGRDLICQKKKEFIIIQCKNWSQFRTIYEKHIFQFFGTVFQYKDANPAKKVKAIFYTSTELSDLARRFAKELNIDIMENYKFDKNYPCIKCNISKADGTKIYHLPFDQQYDNTKIERNKGEFYCPTVKEAEEAGFRRAFRHHLNKGK